MKFLVNGERLSKEKDLIRLCLLASLLMVAMGWLTNLLLFAAKMGLSYSSVVEYYVGSEESFKSPVSFAGLLEITHIHLFSFAVILILLNHLVIFTDTSHGRKRFLIAASFHSAFADMLSGWLIVYVSPVFAALKLSAFAVFEASVAWIIFLALRSVFKRPRPSETGE
jgi:hypothetical protein